MSRQYNVFDYSSCSLRAVVDSAKKKNNINNKTSRAFEHTRKPVGVVVVVERNLLRSDGTMFPSMCISYTKRTKKIKEQTSIFFVDNNFTNIRRKNG